MSTNGLLYTMHGEKKPQGELAMVNQKAALVYVKGSGENKTLVGYTYLEEMMQKACRCQLPSYSVKF